MSIYIALKPELSDYLCDAFEHSLKYVCFLFLLFLLFLFPLFWLHWIPIVLLLFLLMLLFLFVNGFLLLFVGSIQLSPVFDEFAFQQISPSDLFLIPLELPIFICTVFDFCCPFLLSSHLTNTILVTCLWFALTAQNIFCLSCFVKVFCYPYNSISCNTGSISFPRRLITW